MEILYSPFYDTPVFLDDRKEENRHFFNRTYAGQMGLLGILEREFGLSGKLPNQNQRIRLYREALFTTDSETRFFHNSFRANPSRTTREILKWRDELITGGIDFESVSEFPPRIADIRDAEKIFAKGDFFSYAGVADRWRRACLKAARKEPMHDLRINICIPEELLDPVEMKLISLLKDHPSVEISCYKPDMPGEEDMSDILRIKGMLHSKEIAETSLANDGSIRVINGADNIELGYFLRKYLKGKKEKAGTVIIAKTNAGILARILSEDGLPSGAISGQPSEDPVLQILKLIPACIWKPINVRSFIELMMLRRTPFNHWLAASLAEVVTNKPGRMSDDWIEAKNKWRIRAAGQNIADGEIQKAVSEFEFWFEAALFDETAPGNQNALKNRIKELYDRTCKWAGRMIRSESLEPGAEEFYSRLQGTSSEIIESIEKLEGNVVLNKLLLEQLTDEVMFSSETVFKQPDAGSIAVVSSGFSLADEAGEIIYWDCVRNETPGGTPWLPSERKWLEKNNIAIVSPEYISGRNFKSDAEALGRTKKLMILVPASEGGEGTETGNLHAILSGLCSNLHEAEYNMPGDEDKFGIETGEKEILRLPDIKPYWNISRNNLVAPREYESYSSLEDLLYYPYAWVLNYAAKIRTGSSVNNINEIALKGSLAHRLMEKVIGEGDPVNITDALIAERMNSVFDEIVEKEFAVFLLSEKRRELNYLRAQLEKTIPLFLKACRNNNWTSIDFEQTLTGNLGGLPLKSRADVILKKPGHSAVVDIKYFQAKHYTENMKTDRDIQLILYSGLLGPYPAMAHSAYFFIMTREFHAKNDLAFREAEIEGTHGISAEAMNRITWEKMMTMSQYRLDEIIGRGLVEVGESMMQSELMITADPSYVNMPGIPLDGRKKAPKKYNDYLNLVKVY